MLPACIYVNLHRSPLSLPHRYVPTLQRLEPQEHGRLTCIYMPSSSPTSLAHIQHSGLGRHAQPTLSFFPPIVFPTFPSGYPPQVEHWPGQRRGILISQSVSQSAHHPKTCFPHAALDPSKQSGFKTETGPNYLSTPQTRRSNRSTTSNLPRRRADISLGATPQIPPSSIKSEQSLSFSATTSLPHHHTGHSTPHHHSTTVHE